MRERRYNTSYEDWIRGDWTDQGAIAVARVEADGARRRKCADKRLMELIAQVAVKLNDTANAPVLSEHRLDRGIELLEQLLKDLPMGNVVCSRQH